MKVTKAKSKKQIIKRNSSKMILSKYFKILKLEDDILNGLKESRKRENVFCEAIFLACLKRKESKGCFFRTNYPNENENYAKSCIFQLKNNKIIEK